MSGVNLLAGLLPAAGMGAAGFMQGTQAGTNIKQIRQLMAMREAEEARTRLMFPIQKRAAELGNMRSEQAYEQSEEEFPAQLGLLNDQVRNNSFLHGEADPALLQMTRNTYGDQALKGVVDPNRQDLMAMLPGLNTGKIQANMNLRTFTPKPGNVEDRKLKYFNLYEKAKADINALDSAILEDPNGELAQTFQALNRDRNQLLMWLRTELQKLGVQTQGSTTSIFQKHASASAIEGAF